jgi:hypothetical protein
MELVVKGTLQAIQWDELTKEIKFVSPVYENTITNTFLGRIAQWIGGANNTGQNAVIGVSKFQLGTGTGTTNASDTSLFAPVSSSLIAIATVVVNGNQANFIINYPAGRVSGTYTEAGLLDANNVLLTHLLLSPSLSFASNLATTLQYTITVNTQ